MVLRGQRCIACVFHEQHRGQRDLPGEGQAVAEVGLEPKRTLTPTWNLTLPSATAPGIFLFGGKKKKKAFG
jgi:hypothetical protein